MKKRNIIIFIILTIIITASFNCYVGPQLSPMQKRQITTKIIEGSYNDTYRATITVLQDQGYIIKNTDMESGLLVASIDKAESTGSQAAQILLFGYIFNKGDEIEISCMLSPLTTTRTEVRLNIQETTYGQSSSWSGTSKQNAKQIYNPEVYQNIFNEIQLEVKRRQAISGNLYTHDINSNEGEYSNNDKFFKEEALYQNEMNELLNMSMEKDIEPTFIDIVTTIKNKYLMVYQTESTPFHIDEKYKIVRFQANSQYKEIGTAKVVQVKERKVALHFQLYDLNSQLLKTDRILY